MTTLNADQKFSYPSAENGHFVKLDASDAPELSAYPQGVYAVITIPASELNSGAGGGTTIVDNTSYQDVPFSAQVSVTSSAAQITANAKKGWVTLTIDPDTSDVVYIGATGVTTSTGSVLKASNSSVTISSDDLSEWYVIGAVGGEKLYVVGAYIS